MAEEVGASQVREAHLEARMQTEIKKLSLEVDSLKEAYHMDVKKNTICVSSPHWNELTY